jgi:hypothetical protein
MKPKLHLPNLIPPQGMKMANKHRIMRMKTPNPFGFMSGSIAASQKRRASKSPKLM